MDNITQGLEAIKDGLLREPGSRELLLLFSYCLILTDQVDKARMVLDFDITQDLLDKIKKKYPELDMFKMLGIK